MPTSGNDNIVGTAGNDTIDGLAGDDQIVGQAGDDRLSGSSGNDVLFGGIGNDTLDGGDGNDTIFFQRGHDVASGGLGRDVFVVNFESFDSATITDFDANFDTIQTFSISSASRPISLDNIGFNNDYQFVSGFGTIILLNPTRPSEKSGTGGSDQYQGTLLEDLFRAGDGNDTASGGFSDDTLYGDGGDDVIDGGDGSDFLIGGDGNDRLDGTIGDDTLDGGAGDDILSDTNFLLYDNANVFTGGLGRDRFSVSLRGRATLTDYTPLEDTLTISGSSYELVDGVDLDGDGQFDDVVLQSIQFPFFGSIILLNYVNRPFFGTDMSEVFNGLSYSETVWGGGGGDVLSGFAGNDVLTGQGGADTLSGGDGDDTLVGMGDIDTIIGGFGNDSLDGGDAPDWLDGGEGSDTIVGGAGDDTISPDVSFSNRAGRDSLTGGLGRDLFNINTSAFFDDDTITDFNFLEDRFSIPEASSVTFSLDLDGDSRSDDARVVIGSSVFTLLNVQDPGIVSATGVAGPDSLLGTILNDLIDGGDGDDTVNAGSGRDVLLGGAGADQLNGGTGNDTIRGGDSSDTLRGGLGDDRIEGDAGNDLFVELSGRDTLVLGEGADEIWAENFENAPAYSIRVLDFNVTDDRILVSRSSTVVNVRGDFDGDGLSDDEMATFDWGSITLIDLTNTIRYGLNTGENLNGHFLNDTIAGLGGNDTIDGFQGADVLNGGDGNDALIGGLGEDLLFGADGADDLTGGDGNDALYGGADGDWLNGGVGNDTLVGEDGADRIVAADNFIGNAGDDLILGGAGGDRIFGSTGNDYIDAGSDNDTVFSNVEFSFQDRFGNDVYIGGAGQDVLVFNYQSSRGMTLNLATEQFVVDGGFFGSISGFESIQMSTASGNDVFVGWTNNPTLDLGAGNDWFGDYSPTNAASNDSVFGRAGDDALWGLAGDDWLSGGDGNDFVIGGDGADTLDGGLGADWLAGGAGADVFVFTSNIQFGIPSPPPIPTGGFDVVAQFQPGVDKIDLRQLDGNPNLTGFQPLTIGDFAIGSPGRLRWSSPAGQTYTVVEADLNGDAVRDFVFIVYGETNGQISQVQLTAADFVL